MEDESGRILAYLADTVFLEKCNHSTVSMAVVKCLQEYSIANQEVIVFDTAAYIKKAFVVALQSLFPNSLHIRCMAHIMNLIGSVFRKPFHQLKLNSFMLSWSQMFYQAEDIFYSSQKKLSAGKKATMAPNPGGTRWIGTIEDITANTVNLCMWCQSQDAKCQEFRLLNY